MNKIILRMLMWPARFWEGLGADEQQLRAILDVRLKMDDRKPLTFGSGQKKQSKNGMALQIFISVVMGLLCIFPLAFFHGDVFGLFGYFTLLIFLLTFSLITDYANVLSDKRDKYILLWRPVNERTLLLAKMLHLFALLIRTVVPMTLPGWVVVGLSGGWAAAAIFPVAVLLMVFITIFIVNGFYLLILKLAGAQRFKSVITSFQIFFTIVATGSYYVISAAMNSSLLEGLNVGELKWVVYFPSYWLASMWTWVGYGAALPYAPWLGLLAIAFPIACMWVTVKKLAPAFALKLDAAEAADGAGGGGGKRKVGGGRAAYLAIANRLNTNNAARAGFIITWLQTGRSKAFKMKLYPSLVTAPLYFVFMLSNSGRKLEETFATMPTTNKHLFLLYMPAFALLNGMHYLPRSDQFKAAWVYYTAPLETPGYVLLGAYKALWVKYFLPYFMVVAAFVLYMWGGRAALDVVLATINVSLFSMCLMYLTVKAFPFSMTEQEKGAGAGVRMLATFGLIGILATGHYFAVNVWWLKALFAALSLMLLLFVGMSYRDTTWKKIRMAEEV